MPRVQARPALHPATTDAEQESAPRPEPRFDARDVVASVGLVAVLWGVAQFSPPVAFIVLGLALLFVAWRT